MKIKNIIPSMINESVVEPWSSEKVIKFARRMLEEPKPTVSMQRLLQRAKGKRDDEDTEVYMHRLHNMIRASEVLEQLIKSGARAPSQQKRLRLHNPDDDNSEPSRFKSRTSRKNVADILDPPANRQSAKILPFNRST